MTSCRNLKGGFLSSSGVSRGRRTIGASPPCSAACVGAQNSLIATAEAAGAGASARARARCLARAKSVLGLTD